jgi:hypothetical protein
VLPNNYNISQLAIVETVAGSSTKRRCGADSQYRRGQMDIGLKEYKVTRQEEAYANL